MLKRMTVGKHSFKSYEEFKALMNLAIEQGFKTLQEFNKFLDLNCSK
ncbi:hypothetical protein ACN09X_04690 [Aliarcobacter butzleri]|uniref:Uncharacterized protein n=1 Tax=Aliarcobacter butzleri TaxID=28197 RepID=A0AAW7Q0M4_9BACT|nr:MULTISPECIES: hypothetical protein [Arcobacteraceae]MCT7910732.1 hypothetical protein [Arcobacter lacus]MDN5071418.1 hypothetical protein [Aliarcobacter butzleri]